MRITQGTFSYLPDLTDDQIRLQVQYCLSNGWPVSIEYTDDPHPRNTYWEMWGPPMFDVQDAAAVMNVLATCRTARPRHYVRVNGYDRSHGRATTMLSFIVQRPPVEPGFALERQETRDRQVRYTLRAYAAQSPVGERYR